MRFGGVVFFLSTNNNIRWNSGYSYRRVHIIHVVDPWENIILTTRQNMVVPSHGAHFLPRNAAVPDLYRVNRHRVSPEFLRSRDCVPVAFLHGRESAGTVPAILKLARLTQREVNPM